MLCNTALEVIKPITYPLYSWEGSCWW